MNLNDDPSWIITRQQRPANHQLSLLSEIYIERGTKEDWDELHDLHYKAEKLGIGPRAYRAVLRGRTIGVGVMTVPKMLSRGRNQVFSNLKPNRDGRDTKLINRHRALWINAETCTNSRLVLDTMYRGAGIAYRMQNLMMRMTGCRCVEFQSSMSKLNPFASKAGIKFVPPFRSSNYERGLAFFQRWFSCNPSDIMGVMNELNAMRPAVKEACVAEIRKFYYKCSSMEKTGDNRANGTSRVDNMEVTYLVRSLQQLVFASPLYGVFENPDYLSYMGRSDAPKMPSRLPLLAFDNQPLSSCLDIPKALTQLSNIKVTSQAIDLDWVDTNFKEEDDR